MVVLTPGVVSCDMVVLSAARLVVDESALTGEATPIAKAMIDPAMGSAIYDPHRHKSFTLSAGTEILEVDEGEEGHLGLVLATGSFTNKGKLVTDVLSYQRHKFKFDDEVKMVLFMLIIEAAILVGLVFKFIDEDQWVYAWFYGTFFTLFATCPLGIFNGYHNILIHIAAPSYLCSWNCDSSSASDGLCCLGRYLC